VRLLGSPVKLLAIFEMAGSYKIAAARVLAIMKVERLPLKDPTYFLYAHTVELARLSSIVKPRLRNPPVCRNDSVVEPWTRCRMMWNLSKTIFSPAAGTAANADSM
jgi:hypothetical protein